MSARSAPRVGHNLTFMAVVCFIPEELHRHRTNPKQTENFKIKHVLTEESMFLYDLEVKQKHALRTEAGFIDQFDLSLCIDHGLCSSKRVKKTSD